MLDALVAAMALTFNCDESQEFIYWHRHGPETKCDAAPIECHCGTRSLAAAASLDQHALEIISQNQFGLNKIEASYAVSTFSNT